jgi:hypothetical protein
MALVMALIMLLLITILGVSSVRMSSNDTQISGNSIYSVLVFQGAESALSRSTSNDNHFNLIAPATNRGTPSTIAATNFPAEDVIGGGKMNSSGTIEFEGILNGPVFNSFANSSEFNYQVFRVSAQSSLAATAARDRHTEGRAVQIPKP